MSGAGGPPADDFLTGFLDDYFAECEEHFLVIRRALLALEEAIGDSSAESLLLEELFRSFHSIKGISAMVDLRSAERLSHELESYLRLLRDGELPLVSDAVTVLIDGTAMLESVIAARRSGDPSPSIDGVVEQLGTLASDAGVAGSGRAPASGAASPTRRSAPVWRFGFVPSPALVERGVKVDVIRARLGSVGTIVSAVPKVEPGGGISFEFLVRGPADDAAFAEWRADGLTWERIEPEAAAAAAGAAGEAGRQAAQPVLDSSIPTLSRFVRVDLKRLDDLMRRAADLVVTRARLEANLARVERAIPAQDWRALQETTLALERQLRDLREDVMRVRLVRVDEIFRRMPFVVRDLAREAGKEVLVVLDGQDTEIDKYLVERMMDPILHLVRNAVSHGIESIETRIAAGKSKQGTVTLTACTAGEMVVLEVSDDGRGIDAASVAERARAAGNRVSAGALDAAALIDLICEPGFSTRREADRASGRGMGMAVVRTTVEELGGTMTVDTTPGHGTRFTISLPLTLAITDALIAVANGHTFAVPQSSVQEVVEVDGAAIRRLEGNELVPHRGRSLPLLRLGSLLALGDGAATQPPSRLHAFILGSGQDTVALAVDRILGQREIVVRTMTDSLLKIGGISGATELGDGRVVLILDTAALARMARDGERQTPSSGAGRGRQEAFAPRASTRGARA